MFALLWGVFLALLLRLALARGATTDEKRRYMIGEKFLPADIIEHILNLRRLGIQKSIWKGLDGYSWMYTCMPECGYIDIVCHRGGLQQDISFDFGTSAAWSVAVDEYLKLLD